MIGLCVWKAEVSGAVRQTVRQTVRFFQICLA
jgi:hypothetical protein